MPRPSQIDVQRKKLLPIVCQTFSELGYRRTTTAELAQRCQVRENILYRLWPDKKGMFLAAIDDVFQSRAEKWEQILVDLPNPKLRVERLVAYEAQHQGELGFYRIIFTALAETDDEEMRAALIRMYRQFHKRVSRQIRTDHASDRDRLPVSDAAWGLLGLATISNIIVELNLLGPRQRKQMFASVAQALVRDTV